MASFNRTFQAFRDYFTTGQVGDVALLKLRLFSITATPELNRQLQPFVGQFPQINLEALSRLPEGTLGHEYAQHMHKNGIQPLEISPDLHAEASQDPFALRYTVTHDIFHVLLGFDTSYAGEIGVLGFMIGQNYSRMLNAFRPFVKHVYPVLFFRQRQQMRENFRRGEELGKQAKMLLAYDFENSWAKPVDEIRVEQGLILNGLKQTNQQHTAPMLNNQHWFDALP
ncbi:MAG: hypothetical protein F6J97_26045 [Leptolyngbya sp. SIO4C1]|nr:hypothetical protein [Leptolyngbya sp. SIO4C1]